ncbi:MAG TPA: hypothetical protein VM716_02965 [Gemmatimonadales bacterium]|nr:hypothetical protein [Gemmatimonadales bacterium]
MAPLAILLVIAAEAAARPSRSSGYITPVDGQAPSREFTRAMGGDTVPPYLSFPEPGLDDPTAYEGYQTRVYRDAAGNAFQVYLKGSTGRVVALWADAADESVGFTVRDSSGRPAELAWGSAPATIARAADGARSVSYALELPAHITIGQFLLGSMRVERDLQYAGRDTMPLDAPPFVQTELTELIDHIARLRPAERARHLALLGVKTLDALRARLAPRVSTAKGDTAWVVRVEQVSFDGKSRLTLALEGDTRETGPTVKGSTVTIRRPAGGPVRVSVRVTTDAPALTPLSRTEIFNDDFRRFYDAVRADSTHPERFRRLEREVRGVELLCYREKLMAGLPNFATYFGRDMFMAALLMQPVWSPEMLEHVIASALGKLAPDGDVSHEEGLGGQAIREHAAEYNRLVAAGRLAQARDELAHLAVTRENYRMVDDDEQLPLVAAAYLEDPRVPVERKRRFLLGEGHLPRLIANLALVARRAAPYARAPIPTNLVSFPRAPDGSWSSASWRDSRVGYGGGRFAMDVNVIWMPHALASIATILDALKTIGVTPVVPKTEPLARYVRDRAALEQAVAVWRRAERHFRVVLAPAEASRRIAARLASLPPGERDYWEGVLRRGGGGPPADTLRFLALSLDPAGRPIPIVNTDPAMLLLVDSLEPDRVRELIAPILAPYPVGLFVANLGPVTANDAYAPGSVWEQFRKDAYHSPTVVWGRDVNILLAGLARQSDGRTVGQSDCERITVRPSDCPTVRRAIEQIVAAVDASGLRHAELWSYRIEDGRLVPARYGTSSDVQLWSLTDLAVQYLLEPTHP